jgi:hypothetical protein
MKPLRGRISGMGLALALLPSLTAAETWNTLEGVTSAKLAAAGAELVTASIGQTERGEVILTFWRVQGQIHRCVDIKRYEEVLETAYCQVAG